MLIIFDQPLFERLTLLLCGQSLLFKVDTYCSRTEPYCYGVKTYYSQQQPIIFYCFRERVTFEKVRIFGSPCHVPHLRRKQSIKYPLLLTQLLVLFFLVYFFSYCSRITTYCFLLCLLKRGFWR